MTTLDIGDDGVYSLIEPPDQFFEFFARCDTPDPKSIGVQTQEVGESG